MKSVLVFVLLLILCFFCLCSLGFSSWKRNENNPTDYPPYLDVNLPWDARVADLVQRLLLWEVQGQMSFASLDGTASDRLGIGPYQWGTECLRGDVEAGDATAFPQALGLAAAFSPDLIFRVAEATAVEVRGKHNDYVLHLNYSSHTGLSCFSPVINIMRDPRWGRNQETYGEDPFLSGVYAAAFIHGLQGNDTRYVRASGGCKHFDVHGGPENIPVSRFSFDAQVSEEDWHMTFLPAFRMCVEAGTYSVMCSYNRINGVPACANEKLLTEILRNEWGFKGYVVSDGGAIPNIINYHKYYNNTVDTVAGCVNAGCNLELSGNNSVYMSMLDAIKENKLTEAKVREMVAPLFYTRMRLGEFDPPQMNPYNSLSSADVETSEHKALAVEAAMKSFVLLKNNGILPLKATGIIGVVGPMANNTDQLYGDYSPHPPPEDVTTPLEALVDVAAMTQFASGCNDTNCQVYNASEILAAINGTNINFVLLGTGQAVEAEGHDRPDLELPGQQKTLLLDVIANTPANGSIVLILFNAGPLNITFADKDPRVSAILECFFPAQASGEALRHVLLNDAAGAVPAGRLPYTWPMTASQLRPMVNYSMKGRTYRYFEGDPLYPFGYGLSYAKFEYKEVFIDTTIQAGQPLHGVVVVRNIGVMDAEEVIQVYIHWRQTKASSPRLQLVWFNRVTVPRDDDEHWVEFEISPRSMALWTPAGWNVEPGVIDLYAGGQQPNQTRTVPSNVLATTFQISGSKYLGKY